MAQDILTQLHRRGIKLRLSGAGLDVLAPRGALTPELREQLRLRRDDLITLLRRADAGHELPQLTPHPARRYEPFPLTDIQHAYWVGRNPAVELGGVSTHFYLEFELTGIDLTRLNAALHKVIDRHDMLRAVIQPDGQQRILPQVPAYQMAIADLRKFDPAAQEAHIARIRDELGHQVLPADRWPLFDLRASRLDEERARLHVSLDMLIMDALSVELMAREWLRFYAEPDWVPERLQVSYRDYVLAEEQLRRGDRYRLAEEYWFGRLDTLPAPPTLPLRTSPTQVSGTEFVSRRARMPSEQWEAIKQTACQHGFTPAAVLMTAFADVLRLWSGQPSFTLNLTLFNRPPLHPQIDQIIGDFTSVTMLAVEARPEDSFATRVGRLRRQLVQDLEHVSYSGVRVLRERARRLGGRPGATMPVVFTSWLGLTSDEDSADGGSFFGDDVYGVSQTPQVWLDHQVMEQNGDLRYNWDAVEAIFPDGMLDDMFASYGNLLERLSRDTGAWGRSGPLATPPRWQIEERERANDTAAEIPARTLCELVEAQARRSPDAVAVLTDGARLTYAQLLDHSHRLARRLLALGAARDTLVGVVLPKGWQQVAAVLGVVESGAAYLPVDPEWPAARRRHLLEQGRVRVVVTADRLRDELTWPADIRIVTLTDPEVRHAAPAPLDTAPSPADLAYVIFTSGSTGQPKGVMIDHRSAANTIQDLNHRFRVGPADRVLALSALSFDLSVYDVFGTLAAGAAVVMPTAGREHDPAHWTELVDEHAVTLWNSVPALMQVWLDAHAPTRDRTGSALRLVWLSGDWIPVSLPDAIRMRYPKTQVISMGGATEGSIWSIWYPISDVPPDWIRIPYGKALANQTMHVYDAQLGPPPVWTAGEIYIGGVGVARGYWADPERTAERFIVHPRTGQRLYRTGDQGRYLPGGDIEFLGRDDFQVKINGYRIELGEIAATLRRQRGVEEALVDVRVNPRTGRRHLVAYVMPAEPAATMPDTPGGADGAQRWEELVRTGEAEMRGSAAALRADLEAYQDLLRAADEVCPAIMARTLARLGWFTRADDTATAKTIVVDGGLKPRYVGLVEQWLSVLAAQGLLHRTAEAGEYRCDRGFDAGMLDASIRLTKDGYTASGPGAVLFDYFVACADRQVELLRGEVSPLQLLLPGGAGHVTGALYADNPVSVLCNRVAAQLVRRFVDCVPLDRRIRLLEVGGGTGATTASVLPQLPAERARYRFTDISAFFIERARQAFAQYPYVDYGLFDIDRDPAVQGLTPGSVDVLIAANVMHDAVSLADSLGHLRTLLAPGGVLVLIEGTTNSLLQMITVGFVEGLANHQGQRDLPFLTVAQWRKHLAAAGFGRLVALPGTDDAMQNVLVAEAPTGPAAMAADLLRDALEDLLPEYMVPHHYLLIDRIPLSRNGKVDLGALPTPWEDTSAEETVAPRDEMERTLFGIWRDALGRDDFGVEDSFFDLGGDSLHAVTILARLQEEFGVSGGADAGLQQLFDNPTIAALAAALREHAEA